MFAKTASSNYKWCEVIPYFCYGLFRDNRGLRFRCVDFGWRTFFILGEKKSGSCSGTIDPRESKEWQVISMPGFITRKLSL